MSDICRWGGLKLVTFDKKFANTQKQYKIDARFLLKLNRKSYVLYRMVMLPMTLGTPNPQTTPIFVFFFGQLS